MCPNTHKKTEGKETRLGRDIVALCGYRQQYRDCVIWAREYQHSRNVSFPLYTIPIMPTLSQGSQGLFIHSSVCFRLCIRGQAPKKSIMCYVM